MKKLKIFLMALISILLPSCSNTNPPSKEPTTVNDDTERLENLQFQTIQDKISDDMQDNSSTLRFPSSTGNATSNMNSIVEPSTNLQNSDSPKNIENVLTKEAENTKAQNPELNSLELLGSYSSKVYTKTEDRQKNLRIVCEKLSGTVLAPQEEFSYNSTCGPYNKENGFGKATVFLGDGTEMQDYGGGVCQLSSTLYNAVKNLNVEITERHNHSKKVYYVPDGQDATVSFGNLDFKFKNLNNYSLYFEATSTAKQVNVYVYKI